MKSLSNNILTDCIEAFNQARGAIADALELLWSVNKQEAWKGSYNSFSEFCEDGLQISRSTGNQYVAIYQHYVAEGCITVKQLRNADMNKLYRAISLTGTPEQQYSKALTLSRSELRNEKTEEDGHECTPVTVCSKCWKRMEI